MHFPQEAQHRHSTYLVNGAPIVDLDRSPYSVVVLRVIPGLPFSKFPLMAASACEMIAGGRAPASSLVSWALGGIWASARHKEDRASSSITYSLSLTIR